MADMSRLLIPLILLILCHFGSAQYYGGYGGYGGYSPYYSNYNYNSYPYTYNYGSYPSYSNYYWNNYPSRSYSRPSNENNLFGRYSGHSDRVGGNMGYSYGCLLGCKGWP